MIRTAFLLIVLLVACADLPAPTSPQPATLESFRANAALCGPDRPICEARVNHVDGNPVFFVTSAIDVPPGRHVIGLFCRFNASIMIGDAQSLQREVEVVLAPGGRYRVAAGMEPGPCTVAIIDETTGTAVGTVR